MARRSNRRGRNANVIAVSEALESRLLLAAFLKLDGGQIPTPEPLVNVSSDATNDQSEMMIAINPTNPLNVVGFSHRIRPNPNPIDLDLYRSADGGNTWTTTLIDNTDDGQGTTGNRFDPAVAFDANGVLYIVYGYRGTTPDRLIAATSTDGGSNFGNFRVLDSQNGFTPTGGNPLPGVDRWGIATGRIAGTNNQCAVIAYTQNGQEGGNTDQRIAVLGTNNAGNTWTAPLVINDASNSGTDVGNLGACPAIGFDGNLHVSWWDGGTSIFMDTDRDGLFANNFNFGQEQAVRTNQGLVTIGPPGPPAQPERGIKMNPFMVAHPRITGELYITFQERFQTGNDTDIYFGRSTNFGATWTISAVETATSTDFHPVIAVDEQSNMIGVAYYTTDGDQATGNDDVRMRLALTRDFGATWGKANVANQQSNEAGGYPGDYLEYTGLSLRDGTAHVLWASRYALPVPPGGVSTELDALWARVSFDSTANNNRIDVVGTPTGANNTYVIRRSPSNNQYLEIFTNGVRDYTGLIASIDGIDIAANGGNDTFRFENLPPIPIVIGGTFGNDGFNIDFASGASSITINGFAGEDIVTVGTGPSDFLTISSPVSFFGGTGSDRLNVGSGFAQAVAANLSFDGGPDGFDTIYVFDSNNTATAEHDVTGTGITYHGFAPPYTVSYSNVDQIELHGGSGGDSFTVRSSVVVPIVRAFGNGGNDLYTAGDGAAISGVRSFDGGAGTLDTVVVDVRNDPTARVYDITPTSVDPPGFTVNNPNVERVTLLAGTGGDTVNFAVQTFAQEITVDTGLGNDAINLAGAIVPTLTVRGGGGTSDNLNLDDRTFPSTGQTATAVRTDRIERFYPSAVMFMNYDGLEGVVYRLPPSQNEVQVYGVPNTIPGSNSFQILGNAQRDLVIVYPTPATPNIGGPLYIVGAGGTDEVALVDDGAAPATYTLSNPVGGAAFIFGTMVTGSGYVGVQSDVEALNIYGGSGVDNFAVEQFQSGSAFALYGRGGNDTCTIGNGNMQANLTNAAAFTFDGGANSDRFTIANGLTTSAWSYATSDTQVGSSIAGVYSWISNVHNVESQYIFAGSSQDSLVTGAVPPGRYTEFNGAGGYDTLNIGSGILNLSLESIRGPVAFNAGPGGGRVVIDDGIDTTGDVVHQSASTLGAYAGDTLFGPGGSLTFSDLANSGTADGMLLILGQGADTIYAQPLPSARVTIDAGSPFAAPGDQLNLALAGVQNASVTHGASGSVTSSNRQTLSWFNMEQSTQPIDNVAPALVAADINLNGVPGPADGGARQQSLDVRFSENVAGLLSPSWLQLTNLTTNQTIPTANITVAYEAATNTARFTFPGYSNGVLPDGNYSGKVLAGLPDFFGNGLPADANFSFFFLQGDANHDRRVNLSDFNILASNFGQSNRTFSQGDFNYDGVVNLGDFNILASQFGTVLAEPTARSAGGEVSKSPFSRVRIGDVVQTRHSKRLVDLLNDALA